MMPGTNHEPWVNECMCHSLNIPVPGHTQTCVLCYCLLLWPPLLPFFPSVTPLCPSISGKASLMSILSHIYLSFPPTGMLFLQLDKWFAPSINVSAHTSAFQKDLARSVCLKASLILSLSTSVLWWVECWLPKSYIRVLGSVDETLFVKGVFADVIKKAIWGQRQRLEWCCHKRRND